MPYLLNNCTSKTLDYFTPPIVFNRKKPKKKIICTKFIEPAKKILMLAYPLKKATMSGCHAILPNICSVYFYKFTT